MRQRDLISFFAMAFLIAYGILALFIFASETMIRLFGSLAGEHPLFYLAVYAPAIAALTLTLYRDGILVNCWDRCSAVRWQEFSCPSKYAMAIPQKRTLPFLVLS